MTIFYSKTIRGFLDSRVYENIPADAVEISQTDYQALLDGQSSSKTISPNEQGYPVLIDAVPSVPTSDENKTEAQKRLVETDWVNQPDVYDPANTPHLMNRNSFVEYRVQIRSIAVNPVEGTLNWPTEPEAVWS